MAKNLFILLFCFIFGTILVKGIDNQALMDELMTKMNDCKTEVGVDDSVVAELYGHKESSMEGKCLVACLMKKYELMGDDGKFVKDVALAHLQMYTNDSDERIDVLSEIIDKCNEIDVPDDHCEAAEEYRKCFKDESLARNM